jgi:putative FmdB family regulatory protein
MPTYEYRCQKCKKNFTVMISLKDYEAGKVKCPKCKSKKNLTQQITHFMTKTSRKG